jgi:NADH-quinone oxidoreductase subunit A
MTPNPGQAYFPVILQILIAAAVAGAMIGFSFLLGKKVKNRVKDAPYECGIEATGDASKSFSVKFYLVGMLFILFDIEAIFLYPWVVVFKDLNRQQRMFPFFEMLVFVIFILCGFFYIWKMGVLDWSGDSELRASQKRKS